MRRFTDKELSLARRIAAKVAIDKAVALDLEQRRRRGMSEIEKWKEQMDRIMNSPLQVPGGTTPPWWERAIVEADEDKVWVDGFGYMERCLWDDVVACYEGTDGDHT